jgi:NTP pyrophosphatase (non-canonical NTP hydrolase)
MSQSDTTTTLADLKAASSIFARERDWEQFHAPKNLSMAIAAEAGELMEHFLWVSAQESAALCESPQKKMKIEEELADIFLFGLQFANMAKIDVAAAVQAKIAKNAANYPVAKARGRSEKYSDL